MNIHTPLDINAAVLRGDGKTIGRMFLYRYLRTVSLFTKSVYSKVFTVNTLNTNSIVLVSTF